MFSARLLLTRWTLLLLFLSRPPDACAQVDEYVPPDRVRLLSVFLVPPEQKPPTRLQKARLMRHVRWAQDWFRENLDDRDTFELARALLNNAAWPQPRSRLTPRTTQDKLKRDV